MKITLAGTEYEVRPLTLRQIRDIAASTSAALDEVKDRKSGTKLNWDRQVEVVSTALSRDYPDVTPEFILELAIDYREIFKANDAILEFSGLLTKEKAPGEAVAEAA